jgi:hypothetical protein
LNTDKEWAVLHGARGLPIRQTGLRDESFKFLRAGGVPVATMPVTLVVYPGREIVINDGRHRITIARERGETRIHGRILGYGARGAIRWRYTGMIPI